VKALQVVIAIAMIAVAAFTVLKRNIGDEKHIVEVSRTARLSGYAATFLLAIYGGFFSGGYVTMLTALFVVLFGTSFLQAVATTKVINIFSSSVATKVINIFSSSVATKVINIFSSSVATLIFLWRGVVDVKLGVILGISMFLGALSGGRLALLLPGIWLRRLFIVAVLVLAVRMLWPGH
jgi:hypothetical protein